MSEASVGRWIACYAAVVSCCSGMAAERGSIPVRPGPSETPAERQCCSNRCVSAVLRGEVSQRVGQVDDLPMTFARIGCRQVNHLPYALNTHSLGGGYLALRTEGHCSQSHGIQHRPGHEIRLAFQQAPSRDESQGRIKRWHLDLAWRTVFPKLESTKRELKRRLDLPLRADVLAGFRRPDTPIDRRGRLGFNTFQLGIGRQETERLLWTLYLGALAGGDKTHQRILTSNLSVRFRYAYYFTRLGVEYYPWDPPGAQDYPNWRERLKESRPYVTAGFEVGFLKTSAAADFSIAPFKIYKDSQGAADWLMSYSIGAGWAVPLARRWSLHLAGDYSFHLYRPQEFNGWSMITTLRYRF